MASTWTFSNLAVRPALNLNLSSVLFTSAAAGGKSSSGGNAAGEIFLNEEIGAYTESDGYKLTIKDDSRNFTVMDTGAKVAVAGSTVTFSYANAKTGDGEYISAMIADGDDVLYYGQLLQPTAKSGTVSLTIPADIEDGTYTLKLFNEQINSDCKTDYSSDFVDISLTVSEGVIPTREVLTEGYCGGEGDGTNLEYILYADGELVISGEGKMKNWSSYSSVPWYSYRSYVETVTFDGSVTSIGGNAFYNCNALAGIDIPASVTSIGSLAFYGCTSLESITVDEANTAYSSDDCGVLFNKTKTTLIQYPIGNSRTSYTLPDNAKSIGSNAFRGCDALTGVEIFENVTSIGSHAFRDCDAFVTFEISEFIESVGGYAFYGCGSLEKATVYSETATFGTDVFKGTSADFEIHGYRNSTAHVYATENNHTFVPLDCLDHDYELDEEYSYPATCTEYGVELYVCTLCGDTYEEPVTPLGHSMGEWEVTVAPGNTTEGEERRDCEREGCDYYETRVVPAKNAVTITVSEVKALAGREVEIEVAIKNNSGFGGLEFSVAFDNSVLTLTEIDTVDAIAAFTITPVANANATGVITFGTAALSNTVGDGKFATFTFEVAEDAEVGIYPLTLSVNEEASFYYYGYDMIDLSVAVEDGAVEVIDYFYGDADSDGDITIRDAAIILQYLADWDVDIHLDAADADGDGRVGIRDAARILQYLANWDVTLG